MKKICFTFGLIFSIPMTLSFSQQSQQFVKCFIGLKKPVVKTYWATRVNEDCCEDVIPTSFKVLALSCENTSGGIDYNTLNAINPAFEAIFDTITGKCVYQKLKLLPQQFSIVNAQLKSSGYLFDKLHNLWTDGQKKVIWKVSDTWTNVSNEGTDRYRYIECFRYAKQLIN